MSWSRRATCASSTSAAPAPGRSFTCSLARCTVCLKTDTDDTCLDPKYFDIIAAFLLKYIIDPNEVQEADEVKTEKFAHAVDPDEDWIQAAEERKSNL